MCASRLVLSAVCVLVGLVLSLGYAPDVPVSQLVEDGWAPRPSRFITVEGQSVHVRDQEVRPQHESDGSEGDASRQKDIVVLIHGTGSSLHTWEGWVGPLVDAGHRVISFDLPGFGLTGPFSAPPESPGITHEFVEGNYSGDTLARFTWRVLDALAPDFEGNFVLGGNSLGGEVAWRAASLHPERVSKMVLVSPAGAGLLPEDMPIAFQLAQYDVLIPIVSQFLPRFIAESSIKSCFGEPSKVTPKLVDRYFAMGVRQGNRRALFQRFKYVIEEAGADVGRLDSLSMPTLLVWGRRDRLIPPAASEVFLARLKTSRAVFFDDLGHVSMEEDPVRTLSPVLEFISE